MTIAAQPITLEERLTILNEIREQPSWRVESDKDADYYDGNQLDSDTLQRMDDLGMAPIVENLIGPTIDAVLGHEAKNRLDWRVTAAAGEDYADVAQAINERINEAERESRADRACSDAYAAQIKTGLGWVCISGQHDPFKYPIRSEYVHRNEIFWDWYSREPDLSDARYLERRRWHDADTLATAFPKHAELIKSAGSGWANLETLFDEGGMSTGLAMSIVAERGMTLLEKEWREVYRRRLCLSELWYRRWVRGKVMRLPSGRVLEYDAKNQKHVAAVESGRIEPYDAMFTKVRLSWWIGPHKLADVPNPYAHGQIPYVPFWGKSEDMTGVPYGLVRSMRPMQDEVNARNTKMIWLLAAKRVTMTKGVANVELTREEAARPDAVHVLDPEKLMAGGLFKVETDFALNEQQYKALVDKRQAIKNVAGVYAAFEGQNSNATSGRAIDSLVDQSTQSQADIYENYLFARSQVGNLVLAMVLEEIGSAEERVQIGRKFASDGREIILNQRGQDGTINNDIQRARLKVSLSDIPSTHSYRAQKLMLLTEVTKSLPPELQAQLLDYVIAATDLEDKEVIIDRIRKAMGLMEPKQPKTPEEAQAMEQEKAHQQQAAEIQQRAVMADLAQKEANAEKAMAEARKVMAELEQIGAQSGTDLAPYEQRIAQLEDALAQAKADNSGRLAEIEAKNAGDMERTRMEIESRERVAAMNNQAKHDLAVLNAAIESLRNELQEVRQASEQQQAAAQQNGKAVDGDGQQGQPAAPALPPISLNIQVDAAKPAKRSGSIKPDGKGGFTVESEPQAQDDQE